VSSLKRPVYCSPLRHGPS